MAHARNPRPGPPIGINVCKSFSWLIIHGDADKLVPIYQAERFVQRCQEAGVKAKLVVREGKAHGWPGIERDLPLFADWFDEHLRGMKPAAPSRQSP